MQVQRWAADLTIMGQTLLRWKAAVVWVVLVTQMPKHDLGGGFQPALQDGSVGSLMAHGAALRGREGM